MFPFPRERPKRPPWPTIGVMLALLLLWQIFQWQTTHRRHADGQGKVQVLSAPRRSPDAYGRAGDLVLVAPGGASLTIAAAPNIAGHRPLLGAIVDIGFGSSDISDPLIWFRTTTEDSAGNVKDLAERPPQSFACPDGSEGVRAYGALGVGLTAEACAGEGGRFTLTTTVTSLPAESSIVDEINVGSLPVIVGRGALTDGQYDTTFLAFGGRGTAVLVESPKMHASRTVSRFGQEVFPAPVTVRYDADKTVTRSLRVVRGDVLDAIALLPASNRVIDVTFAAGRGGDVSIRDAADAQIAVAHVAPAATRTLRLPPDIGDHLALYDDRGILTDGRVPLPVNASRVSVRASDVRGAVVSLAYHDESGAALPVHVLIQGLDGTPDPAPRDAEGRVVTAGRSLYLLDGRTRVSLPPGRYRFTASHGMEYSLSVRDVTLAADGTTAQDDTVRRVVDTTGWLSADFHLHAAPSPDSDVTLEERVQSLACEGVDLAVATDHNRVTDYAPAVHELGLGERLATASGVEITSAGERRWGHFNAYPLPISGGAPEEAVPVYFGRLPAAMFASARDFGARVVQVNHARMDPGIGYFDLVHLDPKTGRANGEFSANFDAFEAFNGMWIETPAKVREGPVDLVGLARFGKRVAALGDSDSHKLLYEEAGYPRTFVHTPREPVSTRFERAVATLLGTAETTVTSGPFVELAVDGHAVGSVVVPSKSGSVHVTVRVSAPAWVPVEHVEIWRDDVVVRRFDVPGVPQDGVRFEGEMEVAVGANDATILAWADADTPLPDVVPYAHARAIGFTGLVYVDANRDGRVVVPPAP